MSDRVMYAYLGVVLFAAWILMAVPEPPLEEPAEPSRSVPQTIYAADAYWVPDIPQTTLLWAPGACGEALDIAREVGWPEEEMQRLYTVLFRESRCQPEVHNPRDPRGGSHGLMQINGFWCRPNPTTGWPIGYLQQQGLIHSCDDLYDPSTNLRSALHIWSRSGWAPWGTVG